MGREKQISIIIPAYNEQDRIEETIRAINFWLHKKMFPDESDYEIIVINDGSTDETHNIISRLAKEINPLRIKSYRQNKGKGYAVRTGLISAKSPIIMILDADMSVSINEFNSYLIDMVYNWSEQDLIIKGQRIQVQSQPLHRLFVGKGFKVLTWLFTGLYLDTQCPFWILKLPKSFYEELKIDGFAFDVEILYKARQKGYFIIKRDVKYFNDADSKVTLKKAMLMFKELIKIKKNKKNSQIIAENKVTKLWF